MTKTIEPPCVSDGIEAKRSNAPPEVIENVLKRLGKNLYEYRTGKTHRHARMRKFPKGYSILYQPNEKRAQIRGHPSGQIFRSSVKFIPHLQWLESRNKKSPKHNQNPCVCDHCCSQKTVKKPTLEEEERRDYQVRRLAKVVIESVALMPEWLDSFYIPLPELIQPDPRLLQKVK